MRYFLFFFLVGCAPVLDERPDPHLCRVARLGTTTGDAVYSLLMTAPGGHGAWPSWHVLLNRRFGRDAVNCAARAILDGIVPTGAVEESKEVARWVLDDGGQGQ